MATCSDTHQEENPSSTPPPCTHLGFCVPIEHNNDENDNDDDSYLGHQSPYWENWDGGIVGGRPSWLQPRDLPFDTPLKCTTCSHILRFVCQLYAPADQVNPNAFHRSLYVFCCTFCCRNNSNNKHTTATSKTTTTTTTTTTATTTKEETISCTNGIRVLRAQLPRDNPFYPPLGTTRDDSSSSPSSSWKQHDSTTWNVHLCVVCGQRSRGKCPLQQQYFCGKEHQKEYKKYATIDDDHQQHDNNNSSSSKKTFLLPSVFARWELVVEDEPPPEMADDDDEEDFTFQKKPLFPSNSSSSSSKLKKSSVLTANNNTGDDDSDNDDDDDDEHDADANLEQDDLNRMTGASTEKNKKKREDPMTTYFLERLNRPGARNQCIRYRQWPNNKEEKDDKDGSVGDDDNDNDDDDDDDDKNNDPGVPLWIRSDFRPSSTPPPCPNCGAPRQFEFQILPQLLHYLLQKKDRPLPPPKSTSTTTSTTNASPSPAQVLAQACALAEEAPPELLPANFDEQRMAAMASVQNQLFATDRNELDWGTIVVYTCTASCDRRRSNNKEQQNNDDDDDDDDHQIHKNDDDDDKNNNDLGAYMEEFAWWQPPLDV